MEKQRELSELIAESRGCITLFNTELGRDASRVGGIEREIHHVLNIDEFRGKELEKLEVQFKISSFESERTKLDELRYETGASIYRDMKRIRA